MAKCKYFIAGALIGSLVGAAVAVFTPEGKKIREELEKNLEFTKEKGKDFYHMIKESMEPDELKQSKSDQIDGWMELPVKREDQEEPEKEKQEVSFQ